MAVYRQCCVPKEQKHRFGMSHTLKTTPLGKTKVNPKISHRIKVVAGRDQTARSSLARSVTDSLPFCRNRSKLQPVALSRLNLMRPMKFCRITVLRRPGCRQFDVVRSTTLKLCGNTVAVKIDSTRFTASVSANRENVWITEFFEIYRCHFQANALIRYGELVPRASLGFFWYFY